jgi:hypothetical protein
MDRPARQIAKHPFSFAGEKHAWRVQPVPLMHLVLIVDLCLPYVQEAGNREIAV